MSRILLAAVFVVCASTASAQELQAIEIRSPQSHSSIGYYFHFDGYAQDTRDLSRAFPGVDFIHLWAYPVVGFPFTPPSFLAHVTVGAGDTARWPIAHAGFSTVIQTLERGTFHLVAYAHSQVTNTFDNAAIIPFVTIRDCTWVPQRIAVWVPGAQVRTQTVLDCR